jgi:hypothetical protein
MSSHTDPRRAGGSISGPGQPYEENAVVIDTANAVLLDHATVAIVGGVRDGVLDPEPVMALSLEGRINKTSERSNVLYLGNADAMAALVSELIGLATRAGWRDEFMERLQARLDAMPL